MKSNSAIAPEKKKSVHALEATNFFLANVQTGIGPFLAAYPTARRRCERNLRRRLDSRRCRPYPSHWPIQPCPRQSRNSGRTRRSAKHDVRRKADSAPSMTTLGSESSLPAPSPDGAGVISWVHLADLHMTKAGEQNYLDLAEIVDEVNRAFAGSDGAG
jgi:hypothetical protein